MIFVRLPLNLYLHLPKKYKSKVSFSIRSNASHTVSIFPLHFVLTPDLYPSGNMVTRAAQHNLDEVWSAPDLLSLPLLDLRHYVCFLSGLLALFSPAEITTNNNYKPSLPFDLN